MENLSLPNRDPSLWGVFAVCLLMAPVAVVSALLGALTALALGVPKDVLMILVIGAAAVLTVPAWAWLLHRFMLGHWRLQSGQ